jgi:hypothetical protein
MLERVSPPPPGCGIPLMPIVSVYQNPNVNQKYESPLTVVRVNEVSVWAETTAAAWVV